MKILLFISCLLLMLLELFTPPAGGIRTTGKETGEKRPKF